MAPQKLYDSCTVGVHEMRPSSLPIIMAKRTEKTVMGEKTKEGQGNKLGTTGVFVQ